MGDGVSGGGAVSNATAAAEMGLTEGLGGTAGGFGSLLHALFHVVSETTLSFPVSPSSGETAAAAAAAQLSHVDRPPLLAGMLVGAEVSDAVAHCRSAGGWGAEEPLDVTLLTAGASQVASQLLPVYQMAIQKTGGSVDSATAAGATAAHGGQGGEEVEHRQTASGLFALANAVRAASQEVIAAKQQLRAAAAEAEAATDPAAS